MNIPAEETHMFEVNGETYYTVKDLAQKLGKAERTIRIWCKRGDLQAVKRGREWIVSASNLRAYFEEEKR